MTATTHQVTNFQFAARVGCHHTMASRLRNGERQPSTATLVRTMKAFSLDCDQIMEWLNAIAEGGAEGSGQWLRSNIFAPTEALPAAG